MISQAFLDAGRRMNEALMTDTATALIPGNPVDDGEGGFIYEDTSVTFDCRILTASQSGQLEENAAEMLREPGTVVLAYPLTVTLPATATLDVTRRASSLTERYQVVGHVPEPSHPMQRRAILKLAPSEAGAYS